MILIKSAKEIETMRQAGRKTARVMEAIEKIIGPGVTGVELDRVAADVITREGAKPAFKGYMGYPSHICISVNEEVVHGIPKDKPLKDGDIVGVDLGLVWSGYFGDMAKTFPIGNVSKEACELIRSTEESLFRAIEKCTVQNRLGDVSHAVESWVSPRGYSVVRDFVGHGIGTRLHEDPPVPNFGRPYTGTKLLAGMVLAIEPMVNLGVAEVRILNDGWTVVTKDGKLSAHFEHTVAVLESGPEILTRIH